MITGKSVHLNIRCQRVRAGDGLIPMSERLVSAPQVAVLTTNAPIAGTNGERNYRNEPHP